MECFLCCESADYKAIFSCNHSICYRCAAKMLFLYNNSLCPFCKIERGKPIFCVTRTRKEVSQQDNSGETFSDIDPKHEDEHAFYASTDVMEAVQQLLANRCRICKILLGSKPDLALHCKKEHSRLLCTVCLENNHQFWDEIVPYEFGKLSAHRKGTLKEPGFNGHSFCLHCNKYFFNLELLKRHCHNVHQLCTVCETLGLRLQFYNTYAALEEHYKAKHYCCTDSLCLSNKCYVFVNKSELWEHYLSQHSMNVPLSDIHARCGNNPPVVALTTREEAQPQNLYRQTRSIVTPLVNAPYFPSFVNASSHDEPSTVPHCMNREIIHQQEAASASRAKQILLITKLFANEINSGIGLYLADEKDLAALVREIEDAVGNQVCLRILESVNFLHRQRDVNAFVQTYKKSVLFPSFKKAEPRVAKPAVPSTFSIGFKVVNATKRHNKYEKKEK